MAEIEIDIQPTPNPNSVKCTLNTTVIEGGSKTYTSVEAATDSPLAQALLAIDGVVSVFLLGNFVTVSKAPETDWADLATPVVESIRTHYAQV